MTDLKHKAAGTAEQEQSAMTASPDDVAQADRKPVDRGGRAVAGLARKAQDLASKAIDQIKHSGERVAERASSATKRVGRKAKDASEGLKKVGP